MPQLNTIVLKNDAAVDQTFTPLGISSGVATLRQTTGVPIGDKTVTVSSNTTATGKRKVTIKMVVPIVQDVAVSGVSKPTVVRTSYVDLQFTFDQTSNNGERYDVLALLKTLLAEQTQMKYVIAELATLY